MAHCDTRLIDGAEREMTVNIYFSILKDAVYLVHLTSVILWDSLYYLIRLSATFLLLREILLSWLKIIPSHFIVL